VTPVSIGIHEKEGDAGTTSAHVGCREQLDDIGVLNVRDEVLVAIDDMRITHRFADQASGATPVPHSNAPDSTRHSPSL
jgi:hypothetical protein